MNKSKFPICLFCGEPDDKVKGFISDSYGVYICDVCLKLCVEILKAENNF